MNSQKLIYYLQEYQDYLLNSTVLSDYSKRSYNYDINQFAGFLDKGYNNNNIEPIHSLLESYLQELIYSKHLKSSTIKRKFVVLKKFFNYLERNEILHSNPFNTFSCKTSRQRNLPRVLQKSDLSRLLSSIKVQTASKSSYHKVIAIRDLAIIDLLICTGIRIGELARINVQDYNEKTNTLLIKGKGQKERILFISSDEVIAELSDWILLRSRLNPKCESLFVNKYGNTFSIFGIENIFYKYRNISGINPKSTPHYLRHTFASVDTFAA